MARGTKMTRCREFCTFLVNWLYLPIIAWDIWRSDDREFMEVFFTGFGLAYYEWKVSQRIENGS